MRFIGNKYFCGFCFCFVLLRFECFVFSFRNLYVEILNFKGVGVGRWVFLNGMLVFRKGVLERF